MPSRTAREKNAEDECQTLPELVSFLNQQEAEMRIKRQNTTGLNENLERAYFEAARSTYCMLDKPFGKLVNIKEQR